MLFNSWSFLVYFPVVITAYFALPHRLRWAWLLLASAAFYAAFVPAYLLILVAVIGIDYAAGLMIAPAEGAARRRWLLASIVANLTVLGFFKYFNFFADNARGLAHAIGWNLPLPALELLLPIGLSFHVFQSLSYTIEVYRGNQAPERHLGIYALYVMFWPQLVAGPIERPQNLLTQFRTPVSLDHDRVISGLRRMAWGFFKKVFIADRLALLVSPVFADPQAHTGISLVAAAVLFSFQIYCDFSGYSDIALGSAEVMGFKLMENFKRPYFSRSISEFWTRWHVSLSSWFRDYVYIPLGGNRVSRARLCLNLSIVFLLSGLWHGAAWTYVVWGGLHAAFLVTAITTAGVRQRLYALTGLVRVPWLLAGLQMATTFSLVTLAWVFFRAPTLADAWYILAHMPVGLFDQLTHYGQFYDALTHLGATRSHLGLGLIGIGILVGMEAMQRGDRLWPAFTGLPRWARWTAYQAAIITLIVFGVYDNQPFIYFQF